MDISKIKNNALHELEIQKKEVLKQNALSQYKNNLKSIQFKAQADALLEYLKIAEFDSSYLRIKFSSHVNSNNQFGLFFVDVSAFENSLEFKNMLEGLKKQGLIWKIQPQHDGAGMYSWNDYIFEVDVS